MTLLRVRDDTFHSLLLTQFSVTGVLEPIPTVTGREDRLQPGQDARISQEKILELFMYLIYTKQMFRMF